MKENQRLISDTLVHIQACAKEGKDQHYAHFCIPPCLYAHIYFDDDRYTLEHGEGRHRFKGQLADFVSQNVNELRDFVVQLSS